MRIGPEILADAARAAALEWLVGNGVGGSASGTATGALARASQALLAAGAEGRPLALLLRLDERASGEDGRCALSAPAHGPLATLEEFAIDPWPRWRWQAGGTRLEKTLFPVSGHDAIAVSYRHVDGPALHVTASPWCVARPLDEEHPAPAPGATVQAIPGRVRVALGPQPAPALTLWHNGTFLPARAVALAARADGAQAEPARVPGHVEGLVAPGRELHLVFAAEDALFRALATEERLGTPPPRTLAGCVAALEQYERDRLARWRRVALEGADFTARQAAAAHGHTDGARRREPLVDGGDRVAVTLALALRSALLRRRGRRTLAASLPAAPERGADTLRAVQALVALRGFPLARDVLRGVIEYLDEGLAPEAFDPADGTPSYGEPEPSLWLIAAAELYARRSGDSAFLAGPLLPALESVTQALRQGTRHDVRVGADGLLAVRGLRRAGTNALWQHALMAMAQMARLAGRRETAAFHLAWAREHQARFATAFWDEERGCLHEALDEVLAPAGPLRGPSPEQALAACLGPGLLAPELSQRLVATLERELLTPWGLRRAPGDACVSTAALGPFATAYLRAHERAPEAQARVRGWVRAVLDLPGPRGFVPDELRVAAGEPDAPMVAGPPSTLAAAELLRLWLEELDAERAAPAD